MSCWSDKVHATATALRGGWAVVATLPRSMRRLLDTLDHQEAVAAQSMRREATLAEVMDATARGMGEVHRP